MLQFQTRDAKKSTREERFSCFGTSFDYAPHSSHLHALAGAGATCAAGGDDSAQGERREREAGDSRRSGVGDGERGKVDQRKS